MDFRYVIHDGKEKQLSLVFLERLIFEKLMHFTVFHRSSLRTVDDDDSDDAIVIADETKMRSIFFQMIRPLFILYEKPGKRY